MLVVEQNANLALDIGHRGYVLETGPDRRRAAPAEELAGRRGRPQGLPGVLTWTALLSSRSSTASATASSTRRWRSPSCSSSGPPACSTSPRARWRCSRPSSRGSSPTTGMPIVLAILVVDGHLVRGRRRVIERVLIRPGRGRPQPAQRRHRHPGHVPRHQLARAARSSGPTRRRCRSLFPDRDAGRRSAASTIQQGRPSAWSSCSLVECVLLYLLLQKTEGRARRMRAVASNPESSRLVGINAGAHAHARLGAWPPPSARWPARWSPPSAPASTPASCSSVLVYAFAAAALGGFDSPLGAVRRRPDRRRRRGPDQPVRRRRSTASSWSCRSA